MLCNRVRHETLQVFARHHILDATYVVRGLDGTAVKTPIRDKAHLVELLVDVFG